MAAKWLATQARSIAVGLLFHSDRGSQYASDDFVDLIGVFASYKTECVPADGFDAGARAQAKSETFEYIEVFYNRQRLHSTLGYLTPVEAEQAVGVS